MAQLAVLLLIAAATTTVVTVASAESIHPATEPLGCVPNGKVKCATGAPLASAYPTKVVPGEAPWRCRVVHSVGISCTCSILSSRWVLTPGYCFNSTSEPGIIHVFAGGVNEYDWTQAQVATLYRDPEVWSVALLKLGKPLVFDGTSVTAIDFYYNKTTQDIVHKYVSASGYGYHGEPTQALWKVKMTAQRVETCFPSHYEQDFDPYYVSDWGERINKRAICAWTPRNLKVGPSFCKDGHKEFLDYYGRYGRPYLVGVYAGNRMNQYCNWEKEALRYRLLNDYTLTWILTTIGRM